MWHEEMKIVSSFLHNCFILPAAIDFFYFTVALSSKATPAHIFLRLKCDRKMSACYNRILVCVPMLRHIWFILIVKECPKKCMVLRCKKNSSHFCNSPVNFFSHGHTFQTCRTLIAIICKIAQT